MSFFVLPVPVEYTLALNATVYYAAVRSNHSLNVPVFRIRAIVNANMPNVGNLSITVRREENFVQFEGGVRQITVPEDELVTNGDERVVDFSLKLIDDPSVYFEDSNRTQIELDSEINLIAFPPGQILTETSRIVLKIICQSPGKYNTDISIVLIIFTCLQMVVKVILHYLLAIPTHAPMEAAVVRLTAVPTVTVPHAGVVSTAQRVLRSVKIHLHLVPLRASLTRKDVVQSLTLLALSNVSMVVLALQCLTRKIVAIVWLDSLEACVNLDLVWKTTARMEGRVLWSTSRSLCANVSRSSQGECVKQHCVWLKWMSQCILRVLLSTVGQ